MNKLINARGWYAGRATADHPMMGKRHQVAPVKHSSKINRRGRSSQRQFERWSRLAESTSGR